MCMNVIIMISAPAINIIINSNIIAVYRFKFQTIVQAMFRLLCALELLFANASTIKSVCNIIDCFHHVAT